MTEDNEAVEKEIAQFAYNKPWDELDDGERFAIRALMQKLEEDYSYVKLADKPPEVLSDDDIKKIWSQMYSPTNRGNLGQKEVAKAIAQAMLNKCIEHYTGRKP